jgi:hypothetical protein
LNASIAPQFGPALDKIALSVIRDTTDASFRGFE